MPPNFSEHTGHAFQMGPEGIPVDLTRRDTNPQWVRAAVGSGADRPAAFSAGRPASATDRVEVLHGALIGGQGPPSSRRRSSGSSPPPTAGKSGGSQWGLLAGGFPRLVTPQASPCGLRLRVPWFFSALVGTLRRPEGDVAPGIS